MQNFLTTSIDVKRKRQVVAVGSVFGAACFAFGIYKFLTAPPANAAELLDLKLFSHAATSTSNDNDVIWTRDYLIHYSGTTVYSTCTVIKLSSNSICIHSPCKLDMDFKNWIKENNYTVDYIIVPGNYHYFHALEWSNYFFNSKVLICPGVERKVPSLRIDGFLFDKYTDGVFENHFDCVLLRGFNEMWESVLYHKSSSTLITVDIIENIGSNTPGANRMLKLYWKCVTFMWNRAAPAPEYQWFVKDKKCIETCLKKILNNKEWNYTQIILSHGEHYVPNGDNDDEKHEKCQQFVKDAWKQFLK